MPLLYMVLIDKTKPHPESYFNKRSGVHYIIYGHSMFGCVHFPVSRESVTHCRMQSMVAKEARQDESSAGRVNLPSQSHI
jgi:hypothetical protein